jgi:hypothetical protein
MRRSSGADEIPLDLGAAVLAQNIERLLGLDPLLGAGHTEILSQTCNSSNNGAGIPFG